MQTLLQILTDAMRRLAGTGATDNAAYEVERAARTVVELDAQLRRGSGPPQAA